MTGQLEFNEVVFTGPFHPRRSSCWARSTAPGSRRPASSPTSASRPRALPRNLLRADRAGARARPEARHPQRRGHRPAGGAAAHLRRMSVSVAGMLQAGKEPVVEASIVKDIGTVWEQKLPHRVRELAAFVERKPDQPRHLRAAAAPSPSRSRPSSPSRAAPPKCCAASSRAGWACADIDEEDIMTAPDLPKDIGVTSSRTCRHHRDPPAAAQLLRHLADPARSRTRCEELDRDIEIRARCCQRRARRSAPAPISRTARAGAGGARRQGSGKAPADRSRPINHLYIEAVRIFRSKKPIVGGRPWRGHRRRAGPGAVAGFPRHLPGGALLAPTSRGSAFIRASA